MITSGIERDGTPHILTLETRALIRQLRAAASWWALLGGSSQPVRRRTHAFSALARHLQAGDRARATAALGRARQTLDAGAAPSGSHRRESLGDLAARMGVSALDRAEALLRDAPAARS